MGSNTSNDIDEFCRLLGASGLLPPQSIDVALASFRAGNSSAAKYGISLTGFTRFLVMHDILSCWQIAKLRSGQYKGFFLEGNKLVDSLGDDGRCSRYLAEVVSTAELVVVCVVPPTIAP